MTKKVTMFGVAFDNLDMVGAVSQIEQWLAQDERSSRFVVTTNADNVVALDASQKFRDIYHEAALVLADGNPIVWTSRLLGTPLKGTVPGSDLVPTIFDHFCTTGNTLSVYLLGAPAGVAERAKLVIENKWSQVRVVGLYSPALGFENDEDECRFICDQINNSGAALLVIGLGAPKQELWIGKHAASLRIKVALCVGATIEFIAGSKARAPRWMRRWGLEWLHRMASEPRRLTPRYAYDAFVFPRLVLKEFLRKKK